MVGSVSKSDLDARFPETVFLMKAVGDKPGAEQIVNTEHDLVVPFDDRVALPKWLPPLSLRDAAEIDAVIVWFSDRCLSQRKWKWDREAYFEIIRKCWEKRFPLTDSEIWALLSAHGADPCLEQEAKRMFTDGIELLVYTCGRRPIKRKRVKPLSTTNINEFPVQSGHKRRVS